MQSGGESIDYASIAGHLPEKKHLLSTVGSRVFQNAKLQKKFKKQAEALFSAAFAAYREGGRADTQALCSQRAHVI